MGSSSSTSSSDRALLAQAAVSLAVVVLTAPVIDRLLEHAVRTYNTTETFMLIERHKEWIADEGHTADVVFLGDSSLRSSIDPTIVTQTSSLTAMNLGAVSAGGMMIDHHLLRRYLAHHPPPKIVVLMHAHDLAFDSSEHPLYQVHFSSWGDTFSMLRNGLVDPFQALELLLRSSVRAYRYKEYLRHTMTELVTEGPAVLAARAEERRAFVQARETLGYFPHEGLFDPSAAPKVSGGRSPAPLGRNNTYYLERILAMTVGLGVKVYYAHGPMYEESAHQEEASGTVAALNARFRELATKYPNFSLLSDSIPAFPREQVAPQFNHLNPSGARIFSRRVGMLLSEQPSR